MTVLLIISILWLCGLSYTLYRRGRELDKLIELYKGKQYEQETKKTEGEESQAKEGSDNTGHRAE